MLLQCGASPNVFAGNHFQEWTLYLNTPPILALMTRYGMNPDHTDDNGRTCLHYMPLTALNGFLPKLAMMVGIDPNIQDHRGWMALHYALSVGHWGLSELYLPVTDVSLKTNDGETALHILLLNWMELGMYQRSIKTLQGVLEAGGEGLDLEALNRSSYTDPGWGLLMELPGNE